MKTSQHIACFQFPCPDVERAGYSIPAIDVDPQMISTILISEASPPSPKDHYYAGGDSLFQKTTILAFNDAGIPVASMQEILDRGVYLTCAVKCAKTGYGIKTDTIIECSRLLEKELALFPNVKVMLLMGDVAIRALNAIARRAGLKRPVPAGSTYKIRGEQYTFRDVRVFPSYLQAGPSFFIEKSKRKMIAEDLAAAFALVS